jgi:hypothetical protein
MLGGAPPLLSKSTSPTVFEFERYEGHFCPVRWKLLIITSLVAALISVGGMHAAAYWLRKPFTHLSEQPVVSTILILIPLILGTLASIFVYRHTARRRKLQATLAALFSLVLTIATLYIVSEVYFMLRQPASRMDSSRLSRR